MKAGDVVRHVTTSRLMTVKQVMPEGIICQWFEADELREDIFSADRLQYFVFAQSQRVPEERR